MSSKPEAFSMAGVCEFVSLGRSTVYALIKEHKFPPGYKVGSRRLWSRDSLEKWVRRSEREGEAVV